MASQDLRRASSGCADTGVEDLASWGEAPTPWRSVSWTPGAEGAEEVCVVWVKVLGLGLAGMKRRDCGG